MLDMPHYDMYSLDKPYFETLFHHDVVIQFFSMLHAPGTGYQLYAMTTTTTI
jgi:hypothetical protein